MDQRRKPIRDARGAASRRAATNKKTWSNKTKFIVGGVLVSPIIVLVVVLLFWAAFLLPRDKQTIRNGLPKQNDRAGVYAAPEGGKSPELLAAREASESFRPVVFISGEKVNKNSPPNHVPENLVNPILTVEDQYFFEHPGVSLRGIIRAAKENVEDGKVVQGGSTITQQIIKNYFLTPEKSFGRKIREIRLAIALELVHGKKDDLLTYYLNIIYLGQYGGMEIRGVGQAAHVYFGRDVRDLSLGQAAIIAQMIQNPAKYAPWSRNTDLVRERRNRVIKAMLELKKISEAEANKVLALQTLETKILNPSNDAPYAVDAVYESVRRDHEAVNAAQAASLRIQSTISKPLQDAASQAVQSFLSEMDGRVRKNVHANVALVAINPHNGDVLALVGGRNYQESQFNRATKAFRQPGSVFKPFVWAAAIKEDPSKYNWATSFKEEKPSSGWPNNFGGYCNCDRTFADALKVSSNVVAVQIGDSVGQNTVATFAEKAGLPKQRQDRAMFIGGSEVTPLQLAGAYAAFVTGKPVSPKLYREAEDVNGQKFTPRTTEYEQLLTPQEAFIMTKMMERVLEEGGTGAAIRSMGFTAPAAGKTGSSRDAWFVGFTPNLVVVVYVGADNAADIGATGGRVAAPIWANFMKKALSLRPDLGGEFPSSVEGVEYAPYAVDQEGNKRFGWFLKGTVPPDPTPTPAPEATPTPDGTPPPETDPVTGEPLPTPTPPGFRPRPGDPSQASPEATPSSRPRTMATPSPATTPRPPTEENESSK